MSKVARTTPVAPGVVTPVTDMDQGQAELAPQPAAARAGAPQGLELRHLRYFVAVVESRTFEDLKVGDIFRAPSRTLTDAHATAFQAVSADNHPIHYNAEYARSHGHTAPVVHGLQVLAFTAPGATLFPQYIGDVFIAFTSVSCTFLAEIHAGDTLYPQLEITDLTPHGDAGQVTTRATIHNQHGQLVLDGEHTYLLKTAQQSTPQATS